MSSEDRLRLFEYKSIDLETSIGNNILIYGLKEFRPEDCKDIICRFLKDQFDIRFGISTICRAHRIGRYNHNKIRSISVARVLSKEVPF